MTDFKTAYDELTTLLSLDVHYSAQDTSYEKSGIIKLLRGWEKRYDSGVVEKCLSKLSNKITRHSSFMSSFWLFEQKLRHPSIVSLDVETIWPVHGGPIPVGTEKLVLERLKLSLHEDSSRTRTLIETMSEYSDVFERIVKTSQGTKILTSILHDFLNHPQKEMKDNFHAFPAAVLSKCAIRTTSSLMSEIRVLELFEQHEEVNFTKKEGSSFFVKNVLPLIKQINPNDFSEKVAVHVQEFLWHNVSTSHWSKIFDEMRSVGWPNDRLGILICIAPLPHHMTEHQKLNIMMPLWMASDHHREQLMESVGHVACDIPNSAAGFSNLKNMLLVLSDHGVGKQKIDAHIIKHGSFDFNEILEYIDSPSQMKEWKVQLASPQGTDAVADLLPPSLVASYRVVEQLMGGRLIPVDIAVPYPLPKSKRKSLKQWSDETDFEADAQKMYDLQQSYIAIGDQIALTSQVQSAPCSSPRSRKL